MSEQKKKGFLYSLFNRDGKGVKPEDVVTTTGLKGFFYRYRLSFGKLLSINIMYVLGNAMLIFLIMTLAGYTKEAYTELEHGFFSMSQGILTAKAETSAADLALTSILGGQSPAYANTAWTYVFWGLSALTLLTFGCVNVGTAYVLRNLCRGGEAVFPFSDFVYAVKRNYKQAIPMGIIDGLILMLLSYNIYTMILTTTNFWSSTMLWMNIAIFLIYFLMRFYIYVLMVTFDLTMGKIIKNSLIFTMLGIKRNLLALLGIIFLLVVEYLILMAGGPYLFPVAIGYPLLLLFSHAAFMAIYASYFVIKKYMIDPLNSKDNSGQNKLTAE